VARHLLRIFCRLQGNLAKIRFLTVIEFVKSSSLVATYARPNATPVTVDSVWR
jgi:hypothetical protein